MIGRQILNAARLGRRALVPMRQVHKGNESTPPLRFISVPEKIGTYLFICVTFLSYPTYVLLRLDSLRPAPENSLSPETQADLEEHRAARLARSGH